MAFLTGARGLQQKVTVRHLTVLYPSDYTSSCSYPLVGDMSRRNILHRGVVSLIRVSSQTEEEWIAAMEADSGSPARVSPEEKAPFLCCGDKARC
jgi:hypothetical protein